MTSPRLLPLIDELVARAARRGMTLGLARVREALHALGDPQEKRRFVHVTGTNGKGSTSAMVESIARAAGFRTGLYTSPHLCRWAERIQVNGEPIEDDLMADALERVFAVAPPETSFFESLTLAAFLAFDMADIEFGVLEVGIGGRLDATNAISRPLCAAITSIDFDHTAILGNTLAAIAREKAGIFKLGCPAVLGVLPEDARSVALSVAREVGAGPVIQTETPYVGPLSLLGEHQRQNAAVAAAIARQVPGLEPFIEVGLANAKWAGRLERVEVEGAKILLDCAHNPHGAASLAAYVKSLSIPPENVILVFGALGDKAWTGMLDLLGPLATRRVYACPKGREAAPISEMEKRFAGEMIPEGKTAMRRAMKMAGPEDLVVVAGSIYLVGEVRSEILGLPCDPVVAL